jgi:hypothetical protein
MTLQEEPPVARWTVAQAVSVLHRHVLGPAGYRRRRSRCVREDFARREVLFSAARWRSADERALAVRFRLGWAYPPGAPRDAVDFVVIEGCLRSHYDLPNVDEDSLPADLVDGVARRVLPYLEGPTSMEQMVDDLLSGRLSGPETSNPPGINIMRPPGRPYLMAAWGALLLGDRRRCELAVDLTNAEDPPGRYSPDYQAERIAELNDFWSAYHGQPR